MKSLSVSWHQVHAFRLQRQHLLERAPNKSLVTVAGEMCGAQAQLLSAAQISLWARVRDLRVEQIDHALEKRTLVKASCMRSTLFLVPSKELSTFALGSARRGLAEINWTRGKGVPDRVIGKAIAAALGALDKPRTRSEIAQRAGKTLGVQTQAVQGGGWGRQSKVPAVPVGHVTFPVVELLHLAAARGVICYGPYRDNEPTFVRADAWIPNWKAVPLEESEGAFLRKYLHAYGPATVQDFAMWSGMALTSSRVLWEREAHVLEGVSVDGSPMWILRADLKHLSHAENESPLVRLLPYFDSFLLGHKGRDHLLSAKLRPKVYRPQGWVAPVLLVDGKVCGVWEHAREGDRLTVRVEKFTSLSKQVVESIHSEAQDLARFLGAARAEVKVS